MEVILLGPIEVRDGTSTSVLPRREAALLARLALDVGRTVTTDRLVDDLWGETPPSTARNALHVYVSHLRRRLGTSAIQSGHGGYSLATDPRSIDASRFGLLLADAERWVAAGQPGKAAAALNAAMDLWRGDPLADLVVEYEFARVEATRLTDLRATAVQALAEVELWCGHNDAVARLAPLIRDFPFRDRLRAAVMTAFYRQGRPADALDLYRELQMLMRDDLGLDPSPALQALQRAILLDDPALVGAPTIRRSLGSPPPPVPVTTLLGRSTELAAAMTKLGNPTLRLLTILGPGGAGKTRLAIEIAQGAPDRFGGAVAWVPLVGLDSPDHVLAAVATALGIRGKKQIGFDQIAVAVGGGPSLLILDNAEHLVPGIARVVAGLLAECRELIVLVTSRKALNISGEHRLPLGVLAVPTPGEDLQALRGNPAVQLFAERAAQVRPGFSLDAGNAGIIGAICARLDGLPLALELAAARAGLLEPPVMLQRLESRLGLLTAGTVDANEHHQSLRAALDWSHRLLTTGAAHLFASLSVFRDSFSLEAAEAIGSAAFAATGDKADRLGPGATVLDALQELVDATMVLTQDGGRFFLLETVDEFAREMFEDLHISDEVRSAHCEFFRIAAAHRRPGFPLEPGNGAELDWYIAERANLREAAMWAESRGNRTALADLATCAFLEHDNPDEWHVVERWLQAVALDPTAGQRRFDAEFILASHLGERGSINDTWEHLDRAAQYLGDGHPDPARTAKLLAKCQFMAHQAGRAEEAQEFAREAVAAAESTTDLAVRASVFISIYHSDVVAERAMLVRAKDLAAAAGRESTVVSASVNLADLALTAGDPEEALHWCMETARIEFLSRLPRSQAYHFNVMVGALLLSGDTARARAVLRESVQLAMRLGLDGLIAESALHGAAVATIEGDPRSAAILLGCHEGIMARLGHERVDSSATIFEQFLGDLDTRLDGTELRSNLRLGSEMTIEELRDWLVHERAPLGSMAGAMVQTAPTGRI